MKILLLEDDLPTSDFWVDTLSSHHYAVDVIADGAMGLAMASQWPYDLLIVDWLLPSLDGPEVCRRLRAQGSRIPILMLTVRDRNEDIVAGLDAGADDYLAKSCQASHLLARVRALLRRSPPSVASPVLQWGQLRLDPAVAQVSFQDQPIPCRPKEYELLELFLRQPQRLLTRSAIIDHLWPLADTPVEGSVTNLIKDLRQRLKRAGLPDSPIETVYGLGYRLRPEPSHPEPINPEPSHPEPSHPEPSHPEPSHPELIAKARAVLAPLALPHPVNPDRPSPQAAGVEVSTVPMPHLSLALQQATQRFQASLGQRLGVIEQALQELEANALSSQAQQDALVEAHKLAGGLGLFGHSSAALIAEAIESLLRTAHDRSHSRLALQLKQQLAAFKQALAQPQGDEPTEDSLGAGLGQAVAMSSPPG